MVRNWNSQFSSENANRTVLSWCDTHMESANLVIQFLLSEVESLFKDIGTELGWAGICFVLDRPVFVQISVQLYVLAALPVQGNESSCSIKQARAKTGDKEQAVKRHPTPKEARGEQTKYQPALNCCMEKLKITFLSQWCYQGFCSTGQN